ncbi:mannitol dehydrogenase family protein [Glaciibacter superstes]|uniref:mannitol dehydrogenase family protein n=1 Tax=Glaciibacter superstes TaxID=501023 RepID=UPI0003B41DDE|nr:mannitol dehydrogenase family protein [Glaciibacter superstes]
MKTESAQAVGRLSLGSLPAITVSSVSLPRVDPAAVHIGIVHFGIGAFHRAHQAVFTEDAAAATGENHWGILGVTGRTAGVAKQLLPQDCLYGVLIKGASETELRLIGSVRDVAWPGEDSEKVAEALASPHVHLATLTITEKGYLRAPDGSIDLTLPAVQHDLDLIGRELADEPELPASRTPIGLLVRGLARRQRHGGEPFSVVSCDNLVENGEITGRLVSSLVDALEPGTAQRELTAWLAASVTFPSTMVDRIAPATTDADRAEALALLGLRDEALVVAEPFAQWVIEDNFAGPRPAWERAGAILADDVAPYERVKLRVLNATHSLLAWLGALSGYRTIAEAVADEQLRSVAMRVIDEDILPTLTAPDGIDLEEYRDSVLERFANPNLAHTTAQVAMDGSQKLPNRLLGTVADRLGAGVVPQGLALVLAAWIAYVASSMREGAPVLDDPAADRLHAAVGTADAVIDDPGGVIDRVFALGDIFPAAIAGSEPFRSAVREQLATVRELVAASAR